jgi:hypothetical protein
LELFQIKAYIDLAAIKKPPLARGLVGFFDKKAAPQEVRL